MKHHSPVSVAVVGGGAACVSLVHYLVENGSPGLLQVTVFEANGLVGPGVAYQQDSHVLLLNRVAQSMSVIAEDAAHFRKWLCSRSIHDLFYDGIHQSFPSRSLFGTYLRDVFERTLLKADQKSLPIEIVNKEVIHIQKKDQYHLMTRDGESSAFDLVILCIGHTSPIDYFNNDQTSYQPRFLTKQAITDILQKRGVVKLYDIVRLLRRELRQHGEDWHGCL
ncbi:FAD/NAD(P)-binding protein [Brevibacillus humidisoli]|uniref:FAD/NAD(P)-binding protein n=1 Tax=Brevibacillus humidisoli TaxID=2895522 RepID=UPI001E5E92BD|nr:FAD/NAD(P)-binding protein [Brevibacillus humidisoli]UFJ42980.1 FAD/NAD(P)-binding protein [Brevibacillus humidisoli]